MAAQTNAGTTSASVNKFWRKVQGTIAKAFASGKRKEKKLFDSLPDAGFPWSAYENTYPLDLNERGGIASLTDFGDLAKASSVNAIEATVSAVHFNGRFAIGDIAKYADRGMENQLAKQIVVQGTQKVEAMTDHFSDYMHGSASALLATTDTDLSSATPTLTLAAGYGVAGITNAKYLASLFKVGDRIVLLDSSNALIDAGDSFGEVTAVSKTNGTITTAQDGSVTYSTNGIRIYKANNLEGTTAAGGSDLNKGLLGFIDLTTATTVANVSGSLNPNWTVALADTAGGRFTHSRLRKAKDEIMNDGGLDADTLLCSQGVYRDMIAQERAGLRYEDAGGLSFDGDVKAKGFSIITTKNVPPGYAYVFAKAALAKWEILPTEDRSSWGDLQPSETKAGAFGRVDWFGNIVPRNRKGMAYFTGLTEA
jgi:hypothetical protein